MEISDVKRRITETIERAKRSAAERRARADEGEKVYATFLETVGVPLFRQAANVLKVLNYPFGVFTPGGSVRLASERHGEDFIELTLDTTGDQPVVMGHTSRKRGSRLIETERPLHQGPITALSEEEVMQFLQDELAPFLER